MSQFKHGLVLVVAAAVAASGTAAQTDCEAVVDATLEEMRLGAVDSWTEAETAIARSAAGSACLKASSGRYGEVSVLKSTAVSEAADSSGGVTDVGASMSEDEEAGGFKIQPMSGSPSKKPYERARSIDN